MRVKGSVPLKLGLRAGPSTTRQTVRSLVLIGYLQDPLGQAGLMSEAGPVFTIGVVLLGEVRLQHSELLTAETRPDSLGTPANPPTCLPAVQSRLRAADRLVPLVRDLVLSCETHTNTGVFYELVTEQNTQSKVRLVLLA